MEIILRNEKYPTTCKVKAYNDVGDDYVDTVYINMLIKHSSRKKVNITKYIGRCSIHFSDSAEREGEYNPFLVINFSFYNYISITPSE